MKAAPCYGCADRTVGCHAECEKYATWREEVKAANKRRREDNRARQMLSDGITKRRDRYRYHKPRC